MAIPLKQQDYQTLYEICERMRCTRPTIRRLIDREGFPAVNIGGRYISTEAKILEWMNRKIENLGRAEKDI
mgnify:CR=1 FL=1